jgi:hypothetical protein
MVLLTEMLFVILNPVLRGRLREESRQQLSKKSFVPQDDDVKTF